MKKIILILNLTVFSFFSVFADESRLRFFQGISSNVEKYENETSNSELKGGLFDNDAKGNEIHIIFSNGLGLTYAKSYVDADASSAGALLRLESTIYGISYLIDFDDINLEIGTSLTGDSTVSKLKILDIDIVDLYDYEKNNLMFYHLNLGANLSKSVEFIIGISSWDISVSRKENGVVGSKYNSKYSIYNLGLGVLF